MGEKTPATHRIPKSWVDAAQHTKWEDGENYLINEPSKKKGKAGKETDKTVEFIPGGTDPPSESSKRWGQG